MVLRAQSFQKARQVASNIMEHKERPPSMVFMPFERCELLATIKYTTSETLEGHVKQPNKMEVFVVYHFLEVTCAFGKM